MFLREKLFNKSEQYKKERREAAKCVKCDHIMDHHVKIDHSHPYDKQTFPNYYGACEEDCDCDNFRPMLNPALEERHTIQVEDKDGIKYCVVPDGEEDEIDVYQYVPHHGKSYRGAWCYTHSLTSVEEIYLLLQ